ncbi:triacylglycerol lipase [Ancylostoma ceylanicum]|uniref:Triacylglycerol lipase n=1 Tax=Ancylostoma ceylanicum TaxID=53326 RepID=A0A0D6L3I3_9BILA|nr:triacylglycerol lipase [Ancylostoma ceylanicum]
MHPCTRCPVLVCFIIILGDCLKARSYDEYTDDMARLKFFPLAAAAYCSTPQRCIMHKFGNASVTLETYFSGKCDPDPNDSCAGFTAVLHDEKAIVLSFRGTMRFMQLVEEANLSAFHEKVTGHSLGASMASLAASYVIETQCINGSNVQLITYGQPRTGDRAFAAAHNKQACQNLDYLFKLLFSYRVVHWRDIVPHIPMEDFEGYWHHESEVFYPYNMREGANFTICHGMFGLMGMSINDVIVVIVTADESWRCSDGLFYDLSVYDHLHYFNIDVSKYGESGCTGAAVAPPSTHFEFDLMLS